MSLTDRWLLARELARAVGSVALDAAAAPLGAALPLSPSQLLAGDRLRELLARDARGGDATARRPERIARTPQQAPSSNCQNSVFALDWGDASGSDSLPASVFVKQPSADLPTRVFANLIGFWKIECAVCRNLGDAMPIDVPRVYAVLERRSRFVLLMENLLDRGDVSLHSNRDLLAGPDPKTARRCLDTLARLHAGFAGLSEAEQERALPRSLHPFRSPSRRPVMQAVNRLAAGPCHDRAGDVFDEEMLALYRRALGRWSDLERFWYDAPLALVHGDSHLGNFFVGARGMGMLDFQGAHFSQGIRDVQYFLINSMPSDVLEAHEAELIDHYAQACAELGLARDPAAIREAYRAFSFQTLMTAVVSLGLGSFTDSDAVMWAMLERSVAAVRRLDFAGWLDTL